MLTNANKGTYLVKNLSKYANLIYEQPLMKTGYNQKNLIWFQTLKYLFLASKLLQTYTEWQNNRGIKGYIL